MSRYEWVVIIDNGFSCLRCGAQYVMSMPCPVDVFLGAGKGFTRTHRGCRKPRDK